MTMNENQVSDTEGLAIGQKQFYTDPIQKVEETLSTDWAAVIKSLQKEKTGINKSIGTMKKELVKLHAERNKHAADDPKNDILNRKIEHLKAEVEESETRVQRIGIEIGYAKDEKTAQDKPLTWERIIDSMYAKTKKRK